MTEKRVVCLFLLIVISTLNMFCNSSTNPSSSRDTEYVTESIINAYLIYEPTNSGVAMEKVLEINIEAFSDPIPDIRKVSINGNELSDSSRIARDWPSSYFSVQMHVESLPVDISSPVTLTVDTDMGTASGSVMVHAEPDSIISHTDGDTIDPEQDLVLVKTSGYDNFRIYYSQINVPERGYGGQYSYSRNSDTLIIPADSFYVENARDCTEVLEIEFSSWNGSFPEFGEEANMTGTASGFLRAFNRSFGLQSSMRLYLTKP